MLTRRHFMGVLTVSAAACTLGLGDAIIRRRRLALAEIVPVTVLPIQGTTVSLCAKDGCKLQGMIEHVSAVVHPAHRDAPCTEQISLLVAGEIATAPSGRYRVRTDELDLGELDFQIVGGNGRQQRLEAVITRIV